MTSVCVRVIVGRSTFSPPSRSLHVDNGPDGRPSISIGLNELLHDGREIGIQRDGGLEVTDRRLPVAAD